MKHTKLIEKLMDLANNAKCDCDRERYCKYIAVLENGQRSFA